MHQYMNVEQKKNLDQKGLFSFLSKIIFKHIFRMFITSKIIFVMARVKISWKKDKQKHRILFLQLLIYKIRTVT